MNKRGAIHHILVTRKIYIEEGDGKHGVYVYVHVYYVCIVVCKLWIKFVGQVHREGDT